MDTQGEFAWSITMNEGVRKEKNIPSRSPRIWKTWMKG